MLKLDYTKKDYYDLLDQLKGLVPEISSSKWNTFFDSDIGYALVQLMAATGDFNNFFLDRQAAEVYISTCELRSSAVALAKGLGYTPLGVESAVTTIQFELSTSYNYNIPIPKGCLLTINNYIFSTDEAVTLLSGETTIGIPVTQGYPFILTQTSPETANYKILLPKKLSGISVVVNDITWAKTDTFLFPIGRKTYKLYEDINGWILEFGNGITTDIPSGSIVVSGILSDGASCNFYEYPLSATLVSPLYDTEGNQVSHLFNTSTTESCVGGRDLESIESIKSNAPAFYTTQNRVAIDSDYQAVATSTPGVEKANSWGGQIFGQYGSVYVCVCGADPLSVPNSLLNLVYSRLEERRSIPLVLHVIAPTAIYIDITAKLYAATYSNQSLIQAEALTIVNDYIDGLNIGDVFQNSDLVNLLSGINNVDYVGLTNNLMMHGTISSNLSEITLPKYSDVDNVIIKSQLGTMSPALFTGGGISDIIVQGTYTGSSRLDFVVQIDAVGVADKFKWSNDGGVTWEDTNIIITGAYHSLSNGISIKFTNVTGHTLGDKWTFSNVIWDTSYNNSYTWDVNTSKLYVSLPGLADQDIYVYFNSLYPDVYPYNWQLLVLNNKVVTMKTSGSPV